MQWYKTFQGTGNWGDRGRSVLLRPNGDIYVIGYSFGNRHRADYTTIKYNSSGIQQWVLLHNSGSYYNNNYAYSILNDTKGNIFVTGSSEDPLGNYPSSIDLLVYDSTGANPHACSFPDYGGGFSCIDSAGYIYQTGSHYDPNNPDSCKLVLLKYSYEGTLIWFNFFHSTNNSYEFESPSAIGADTASNIYITGFCADLNGRYDIFTLKFDKDSHFKWVKYFNGIGNSNDRPWGMAGKGNSIYVTGYTTSQNSGYDMVLLKYNSAGDSVWSKTYDGVSHYTDIASDVCVDSSDNVYIAGYSTNGYPRFTTVKFNSSGTTLWAKTFDLYPSGAMKICLDKDQNIYATGNASLPDTNHAYCTIKYDPSGNIIWYQLLSTTNHRDAEAYSIAVDDNKNVVITGEWNYLFTTVKYQQTVAIKQNQNNIPCTFSISQNYPNPFNPSTKIKFDIPNFPLMKGARGMSVQLTIYDLLGREVATLVNQQLQPGLYEVEFDASNYPSGVYFYRLTSGDFTSTQKMVLLK
jgi:hypothetical protein